MKAVLSSLNREECKLGVWRLHSPSPVDSVAPISWSEVEGSCEHEDEASSSIKFYKILEQLHN
jgi:hypothetical protein